MHRPDLCAEMRAACEQVSALHLRRLHSLGVSWETIGSIGADHYSFGVVHAVEHPSELGLYCLNLDGPPMICLPVYDNGDLIDLIAFKSNDPDRWLWRTGLGWCLGLERGLDAHTWHESARLCLSPLEWLQEGATGLCVLDWDAPEAHELSGVPHLVCTNAQQASMLRKALTRPAHFPTISIQQEARLAA